MALLKLSAIQVWLKYVYDLNFHKMCELLYNKRIYMFTLKVVKDYTALTKVHKGYNNLQTEIKKKLDI